MRNERQHGPSLMDDTHDGRGKLTSVEEQGSGTHMTGCPVDALAIDCKRKSVSFDGPAFLDMEQKETWRFIGTCRRVQRQCQRGRAWKRMMGSMRVRN